MNGTGRTVGVVVVVGCGDGAGLVHSSRRWVGPRTAPGYTVVARRGRRGDANVVVVPRRPRSAACSVWSNLRTAAAIGRWSGRRADRSPRRCPHWPWPSPPGPDCRRDAGPTIEPMSSDDVARAIGDRRARSPGRRRRGRTRPDRRWRTRPSMARDRIHRAAKASSNACALSLHTVNQLLAMHIRRRAGPNPSGAACRGIEATVRRATEPAAGAARGARGQAERRHPTWSTNYRERRPRGLTSCSRSARSVASIWPGPWCLERRPPWIRVRECTGTYRDQRRAAMFDSTIAVLKKASVMLLFIAAPLPPSCSVPGDSSLLRLMWLLSDRLKEKPDEAVRRGAAVRGTASRRWLIGDDDRRVAGQRRAGIAVSVAIWAALTSTMLLNGSSASSSCAWARRPGWR